MLCVFLNRKHLRKSDCGSEGANASLPAKRFFVFFGAAILGELDHKKDYGGHQQEMDHAALV